MKKRIKLIILSLIIFLLDRISKIIIVSKIAYLSKHQILKNILSITYVKNTGAAWSILEGKQLLLIAIGIIFLSLILLIALKEKSTLINTIQYALILGGGLGNLYDRIFLNYVIDFISIDILNFPIFNLADMFICIGTFMLIISVLRSEKA